MYKCKCGWEGDKLEIVDEDFNLGCPLCTAKFTKREDCPIREKIES